MTPAPPADSRPHAARSNSALAMGLLAAALVLVGMGLAAGSQGWSLDWSDDRPLITAIRAPRTLGALFSGALLGLAGALAQGLFRNPLADPYLLGSASGASLAVVFLLSAGTLLGDGSFLQDGNGSLPVGLTAAAFLGALGGVGLTVLIARGSGHPAMLLLSGVVAGVILTAISDLLVLVSPEALRNRHVFMLGTTAMLGWNGATVLAAALTITVPLAMRYARVLDALVLGEATASSLGVQLHKARLLMVALMALCTGCAVAQAGLVGFVGLAAPHLVRRYAALTHAALLPLSALAGGVLLLAADVTARVIVAPQELPVGILTAVVGGSYLMVLLWRTSPQNSL